MNVTKEARKASGICIACGANPASKGKQKCDNCRERAKETSRALYSDRLEKGLCTICGKEPLSEKSRICCESCRVARNERDIERNRVRRFNKRKKVISHYGGKCACCGEDELQFLAIDHIEGGGKQHREEIGGSGKLVDWIIRNSFPEGFQILCHNCNMSKYINRGFCVHRTYKTLDLADAERNPRKPS